MLRSPFLKTVSFVLGFTIVTGSASAQVATEWSYGKAFDLGKLAGAISSQARAINNLGEVVGYSAFNTNSYTATAWIGGVQTTLPSLAGTEDNTAYGVNDFGLVVGNSVHDYLTYNSYAVQWNHGALAKLPGAQAAALGVNDFGVAVGAMGLKEETAVEWKGGALIDLPGLPGAYSAKPTPSTTWGKRSAPASWARLPIRLTPSSGPAIPSMCSPVRRETMPTLRPPSTTSASWPDSSPPRTATGRPSNGSAIP